MAEEHAPVVGQLEVDKLGLALDKGQLDQQELRLELRVELSLDQPLARI
jgi:hypothetical protein